MGLLVKVFNMIFKNILKDKYFRVVSAISLLLWLVAGLIFYAWPGSSSHSLILHFDANKGVDFLGGEGDIFGILLSGLIIILINLFLSNFLYNRERFLAYIFSFANLLVSILILIVISVIINVN